MIELLALVLAALVLYHLRGQSVRITEIARRLAAAERHAEDLDGEISRLRRGLGLDLDDEPLDDGEALDGAGASVTREGTPEAAGPSTVPPAGRAGGAETGGQDEPAEEGATAGRGRPAPDADEDWAGPRASGSDGGTGDGAGQGASVPPTDATLPPPLMPQQPSATSLEERLGTRWAVWVGGIALALGGLLLVRYSIEQGWFGPGARIIMGLIFSALLIGAGEWFRRNERGLPIEAIPAAHIPSVLTAAGTSSAFGTIYAAHALYGFIGSGAAFLALGAVGIATMLAAALHGPALAGLGLAGSYVAPLLVSSARPSPWPLMIYLTVVAASAMALSRLRSWLWLAALAVGGAVFWGLAFAGKIANPDVSWTYAAYLHCLVQLTLAAFFLAIEPNSDAEDKDAVHDGSGVAAMTALGALSMIVVSAARFDAGWTLFALAACAILVLTAYRAAPVAGAAVVGGLIVLVVAAAWPGLKLPPPTGTAARWPEVVHFMRLPDHLTGYLAYTFALALAVFGLLAMRLRRGQTLRPPVVGIYGLAATLTPLLALVVVYLRVTKFETSIPFAGVGITLAALFAVVADRFQQAELPEFPGSRLATGLFAAAAIAATSFALTVALERGYLTVALALSAYGTAFVAVKRDIPLLRHVVTALALVVLARIVWDPRIMGADVGQTPILNWLLLGYGVPAVAFWGAARLLEAKGPTVSARLADAAAVLFAGLLCFFEVHHALNDGDALARGSGHVEQGLLTLIALGFSYALMRLDLRRANPVFYYASLAFGALSMMLSAIGLGLSQNPLLSGDLVAGPQVFSSLALAYLVPGLAAVLLARASRGHRPPGYLTAIAVLALLLVFGYVTLEVRHIFQGELITITRRTSAPEQWAYSLAWLALGLMFLAYGIWRRNWEARLASAALVMLSVAKVFLWDLSGLTGLWRALSFIVLGLVLIGIGLAYQKLLFAKPATPPSEPEPQPDR